MGIFSSKDKQVTNTGPWAPQQPYIQKGFREASKWYDSGGPQYYEGNTVVDRNPLINQSEDALMNYFGSSGVTGLLDSAQGATQNMLGQGPQGYGALFDDPNVGSAYSQLISGDPSPYIKDAADAADADMMESFNRNVVPGIRDNMVLSGHYGGSTRSDMMNERAVDDLTENMSQNRANMYQSSYENAQNRMLGGLGQAESARSGIGNESINRYGQGMSGVPGLFDMNQEALSYPGLVGTDRMNYDQRVLDSDIDRWNYNQNLPLSNLQNYMGLIGGNYGNSGTTVNESRDSAYNVGRGLFKDSSALASLGASFGLF